MPWWGWLLCGVGAWVLLVLCAWAFVAGGSKARSMPPPDWELPPDWDGRPPPPPPPPPRHEPDKMGYRGR